MLDPILWQNFLFSAQAFGWAIPATLASFCGGYAPATGNQTALCACPPDLLGFRPASSAFTNESTATSWNSRQLRLLPSWLRSLQLPAFTQSTSHLSRGMFSCGIKQQHALWKRSWPWQGKKGCGAHNATLKSATRHNIPKRPRQAGEPPNIIEGQHHTSSKKQTKLYLRPHGLFLNVLMTFWTVNERWIQVSFETFMARLV